MLRLDDKFELLFLSLSGVTLVRMEIQIQALTNYQCHCVSCNIWNGLGFWPSSKMVNTSKNVTVTLKTGSGPTMSM